MASVITIAGEKLFAEKAQANEQLDIDTFIFANVPAQDPAAPINRDELLPSDHIVHQQIVQQVGRINENVVVYSTVLDSVTGPFEFNWVGLFSSVNQTLVAINHIPSTAKTITEPGAAGNTLNRNFGIEYSGIADLTGINVAPETWQLDFTARLSGMDELTQQLAKDLNGVDSFIDDGFKVTPRSALNSFEIKPGVGYINGLRAELKEVTYLNVSEYPKYVYGDAYFEGDAASTWAPRVQCYTSDVEIDDFIDEQGRKHFLAKLAIIHGYNEVEEKRIKFNLRQDSSVRAFEKLDDAKKDRLLKLDQEFKVNERNAVYKVRKKNEEVVDNTLAIQLYENDFIGKLMMDKEVTEKNLGIVAGDVAYDLFNIDILDSVRDILIEKNIKFVIDSSEDIAIRREFKFVRSLDLKPLRIKTAGGGGFLRTGIVKDEIEGQKVLSVGEQKTFVKGVRLEGGLPVRFSSLVGSDGKLPNRRGRNTTCLYLGNMYDFEIDVILSYGENAIYGKSIFNGSGKVNIEWCHKGWALKPLSIGSAGSACTSLDFNTNFDFTIHPFDIENVVYSKFKGYCQAIRMQYEHYESDEIAIIFRDEGLGSVSFEYGIEAVEAMYRYNSIVPSYIDMKLRIELGNSKENHFEIDASRVSNVPFLDQAYFSTIPPGVLAFKNTQFSGSTVRQSTNETPVFHKPNKETRISLDGGYIESGEYFKMKSNNSIWENVSSTGARFENGFLYPDGNETNFNVNNGINLIDLGEIEIDSNGEVEINAPSGFGRILFVNIHVVRSTNESINGLTIMERKSFSWKYKTGLGNGFFVNASILCLKS
ncbi:hypothetical protein PNIG_a1672 [Pseudoalteromonas nigrifaciens]|uniref:Phage tail fibre protein N-terminal domain-containing protein n=1 Tax=Pseudoalteromonas nigrifaciens TaxID=28109 RepID=A0AAC9XXJ0_9GAMM|nr:phage tail protein [Pseudoalteromonas nigrifaciens]ASM53794.1 hypothetical protein PNIG_a1672 [Pseudoalteromonas nigrifaciens]GEN40785.1 hypothetical protein PNI02_02510 [Pseudoalteromonas nigrifaciens]SUC52364.1 Tail fiber protein [Pseudoalteromonas nigrifaciens]